MRSSTKFCTAAGLSLKRETKASPRNRRKFCIRLEEYLQRPRQSKKLTRWALREAKSWREGRPSR
jgi:hypothetical protein